MSNRLTNYVTIEEASKLPRRLRVAWASSVYERVLNLYSPQFRSHFLQQAALDVAWKFACGEIVPDADELLARIEDLIPEAEDEDYGHNAVFPGMLLLSEVAGDERQGSVQAVDNAGVMFAAHHLYRVGVSSFDPAIPQEYEARLEGVLLRFARELFDLSLADVRQPIWRRMFSTVDFAPEVPSLDRAILAEARTTPPRWEAEFIRTQGWT